MLQVNNKVVLRRIVRRNLAANRQRTMIAVLAIALTTSLFVSVFAAVSSINNTMEQETFREVGGYGHAGFKEMTPELIREFQDDPMIVEYGTKWFLAMPEEPPFQSSHVEIVYMDETEAKLSYCRPESGRLPQTNSEVATDTRVLDLLGVPHEVGQSLSLSYRLDDGKEITDTFTLTGWWEFDPVAPGSMVIVSRDYVAQVLKEYQIPEDSYTDTGSWAFDFLFRSSVDIEGQVQKLLERHGYQMKDPLGEGYVRIGINWGYTAERTKDSLDPAGIAVIVVLVLVIYLAGYLIIYNIFRISVGSDIRFYGMLQTIGTTGRQLKNMVHTQARYLMYMGIPLGLFWGIVFGNLFVPMIMKNFYRKDARVAFSLNPQLLLLAVLLSVYTVSSSCNRPARLAARVSPMEALNFREETGTTPIRGTRKGRKRTFTMFVTACANVGRNKGKTASVVLSLAISVLLLNLSAEFTHGFDLDKFLSQLVVFDYAVAHERYFNYDIDEMRNYDVSSEMEALGSLEGVEQMGAVYLEMDRVQAFYNREQFRSLLESWDGLEDKDTYMENNWKRSETDEQDRIHEFITLYGLDPTVMEQLQVLEGDLEKLQDSESDYIVQILASESDYVKEDSTFQVGDQVTVLYGIGRYDNYAVNAATGERVSPSAEKDDWYWSYDHSRGSQKTYTLAAVAVLPRPLSARMLIGGEESFALSDGTFCRDVPEPQMMLGVINVDPKRQEEWEDTMEEFTEQIVPDLAYESKETYAGQFYALRRVFLLIGFSLSGIIGLIGVLNFCNTLMTDINARRRELAVMQAVGMTGNQMLKMLVYEGLLYTGGAMMTALVMIVIINPLLLAGMNRIDWFLTPQVTFLPFLVVLPIYLCLGIVVPWMLCRKMEKHSVVERLGVTE